MSTFSKIPDVDREILFKLPNRDILELCKSNLYFFNRVCNDNFFYRLLLDRYPDFIQYKQNGWSWKRLFLTIVFNEGLIEDSEDVQQLFFDASRTGKFFLVKLLLADKRVDPSKPNNLAIRFASQFGHVEVVKLLLADKRVNPATLNNIAIRVASRIGHLEVVKLLLADPRVDPADGNNYAIRWASEDGHLEVVNLLKQDPRVQALL